MQNPIAMSGFIFLYCYELGLYQFSWESEVAQLFPTHRKGPPFAISGNVLLTTDEGRFIATALRF